MIHFIWAILNVCLAIAFLVVCYKGTKLLKNEIGLWAALIFVLGLLSLMNVFNKDVIQYKQNEKVLKKGFSSSDNIIAGTFKNRYLILEKNLVSDFNLSFEYGQAKISKLNTPIDADIRINGTTNGIRWKPMMFLINETDSNTKFSYDIYGLLEWKLMGITLYTQHKSFKGFVYIQ
jgi:hypothetical protein